MLAGISLEQAVELALNAVAAVMVGSSHGDWGMQKKHPLQLPACFRRLGVAS
jgi:hypothetical protein